MSNLMRLVFVLSFLSIVPAHAATYHVAKNGSDSHSCAAAQSPASAKGTINAGIRCLGSGDTLVIGGGTYQDQCLGDFATADVAPIPPGSSWSAPTTIRNAPGETVLIRATRQCDGGNTMLALTHVGHYIVIDGINITGDGTFQLVGIGSRYVHLKNMVLSHGREGIQGGCDECLFENVTTRYMGYNEQMGDVCPVPDLGCHGIYMSGGRNTRLTRITAYKNTGIGVTVSCEGCGGQVSGNTIEHSTIYQNKGYGILTYPGHTIQHNSVCHNLVGILTNGSRVFDNRAWGNEAGDIDAGNSELRGNRVGAEAQAAACPAGGAPPAPRHLRVIAVP
jgi:hypothetical protein